MLGSFMHLYINFGIQVVITTLFLSRSDFTQAEVADFLATYVISILFSFFIAFHLRSSRNKLKEVLNKEKDLNQQMLHSKKLLEHVETLAQIGNWEYDIDSENFYSSSEISQIYSHTGKIVKLEQYLGLHDEDSRELILKALKKSRENGDSFDIKFDLKTDRGELKKIRSIGYTDLHPNGRPRKVFGMVQDISHYHRSEMALREAKELAESNAKAKSQFLATMSHEIRTPLNAVINLTRLLHEENPRPDQLDHIETLAYSAETLLTLINDILDQNKIDAGRLELEQTPFNLYETGERIVQGMTPLAVSKDISIKYQYDTRLSDCFVGDPVRLGQILTNLIGNAIKFTEKGEVSLIIESRPGGGQLIQVVDTGIGIPLEKQKLIFDPFSQAASDTNRIFGGTGLGLSIASHLISLMGSTIELQSIPGEGSRFSFRLNLPHPDVKQGKEIMYQEQPILSLPESFEESSILVAEDNPINQKIISRYLEKWKIDYTIVKNGREVIDALELSHYDLILMDIQMPVMDGLEATQFIRRQALKYYSNIPIIALTASVLQEEREEFAKAGINDFFGKPFHPDELYQALAQHLSIKRSEIGSQRNPMT